MKKESIKTIILCLLIVNCLQLTGQIWLDEKLWPTGYNFFSYAGNLPIIGGIISRLDIADASFQGEVMFGDSVTPEKVVAGDGGARAVYSGEDDGYNDILKFSANILSEITSDLQAEAVNSEEIKSYLVSECIYIDFGYGADYGFLFNALDVKGDYSFDSDSKADSIVISAYASGTKIAVSFVSKENNTAQRYVLAKGSDELSKYIDKLKISTGKSYAFAFDLNLDKNENTEGGIVLSPLVLLNVDKLSGKSVTITNPFDEYEDISKISDKIVTALGYMPNTLRRVVRNNGTVSYVENDATVTVYPEGIVEYTAATAASGIAVKDSSNPSSVVKEILGIIGNIYSAADVDTVAVLHPVESLKDTGNGSYNINMDYYIHGIPLKFSTDGKSAVSVTVEKGVIREFSFNMANIEERGETVSWPSVLEALDTFADRNENGESRNLSNIAKCYLVSDNQATAGWLLTQSDGTKTVIDK